MNIETAIRQMLRGELGILYESDEEISEIYDACRRMGVNTEYIDVDDYSNGYRLCGYDEGDVASWYDEHAFKEDYPGARVEKFSDLICESVSVDCSSLL